MIWTVALLTAFAAGLVDLDQALRLEWAPRERPVRSEWCEQNVRLPDSFASQPGPFTLAGREYQREIIDAVDDPETREIAFVGVPQIGKTEALRQIVASQGEVDAAPMMFAGPDQPYAREQREIIYRTCDASPTLAAMVPSERLRNDRWIDLKRCYVFLAWSGSSQRLSGRACKIVLCSECDRWQLSVELAQKRTRAFWRSCVIYEGSPVGSSPVLWPLYQASDRRTFRVPCPHCGKYQELRFFPHKSGPNAGRGGVAGMQSENGNWLPIEEARKAAHYVCENGCRIESHQKAAMVRRGVWAPAGCEVVDGKIVGKPANPGRRRGYQINALYAPTVSWGDAAEAWLQRRDSEDGRKSFFNDWLALPFEPRGNTPKWKDLGVRLAGDYPRGSVPPGAYFLVAAADVQERGVYWSVRAFGDRKTSWLIDWGYCRRLTEPDSDGESLASDLSQLSSLILRRRWSVLGENPCGLSSLAARILGVDRGYRPTDVYRFVKAHPGGRVVAVFGDPKISPGALYRFSRVEKNARTGEVYPEGIGCWGIETHAYKSEIADRWGADRRQPGVWWLPSDVLAADSGEDYLRQITAETRKHELLNGRKVIRWDLISKGLPNHYWDTEVYCAALADLIVGNEWDAEKWPWVQKKPERGRDRDRDREREESVLAGVPDAPEEFTAR